MTKTLTIVLRFFYICFATSFIAMHAVKAQPSPEKQEAFIDERLTKVSAANFNLSVSWRCFFFQDQEYGGKVFVAEVGERTRNDAALPTVFLIHGLGQNGLRDWLNTVPALEQHYHLVLLDLPGFGNSDTPKAKLTPTRYSRIIHRLKPLFSTAKIAVVGHSMGGAIALRYTHTYPDDVEHLLLVDAAGILQRTAFVKHSATGQIPIDQIANDNALLGFVTGLSEIGTGLIEKLLSAPDPTRLLGKSDLVWGATLGKYPNLNAALGLIDEDFSQALYELPQPVSILWGTQDPIAPLRTSLVLADNLPRAELHQIAGAGHVPMTTHATEFNQWINAALIHSVDTAQEMEQNAVTDLPNYECNNKSGELVTGHYRQIKIKECIAIKLSNLSAQEVILDESVVQMERVNITGNNRSLKMTGSTLIATATSMTGKIEADGSRLDFAGVTLQGDKPFKIKDKSRLVISVSRTQTKTGVRYLHADKALEDTYF